MWQQFQHITLNGIRYNKAELQLIADVKLKNNAAPVFEKSLYQLVLDWLNADAFITTKTSGSTGPTKEIKIEKQKMVGSAFATTSFFKLNENTQALLCLSCEHIAGKMMVARAFVSGMNLIVAEPSSLPLKHFLHQKIDFAAFVPMQIFMMLNDVQQKQKLQEIENVIIGGSEISPSIKQQLNAFQNNIYETFGMTETVSHIALKLLSNNNEQHYFKTLENITVSKNENNCLVIEAPHLDNKPIITNDIVNLIDDKTFEWIGRIDNVIVSGGIKFYPESIEQKLKPIIQQPFFVAGIPNEKLGAELVLIIEYRNVINEELFMQKFASVLTKYELPKKIFTVAEFIYTPNGKLNRTTTIKQMGKTI